MIPGIGPAGAIQTGLPSALVRQAGSATPAQTGGSFGDLVSGFVERTNAEQLSSQQAIEDLVHGRTDNIQDVVLAVSNAEMSFQLFMEIRNKVIEAWNELMRMQF